MAAEQTEARDRANLKTLEQVRDNLQRMSALIEETEKLFHQPGMFNTSTFYVLFALKGYPGVRDKVDEWHRYAETEVIHWNALRHMPPEQKTHYHREWTGIRDSDPEKTTD